MNEIDMRKACIQFGYVFVLLLMAVGLHQLDRHFTDDNSWLSLAIVFVVANICGGCIVWALVPWIDIYDDIKIWRARKKASAYRK